MFSKIVSRFESYKEDLFSDSLGLIALFLLPLSLIYLSEFIKFLGL